MNREQKENEVSVFSDRLKKVKAMIFTDFKKLKVAEMTDLRSKLRKSDSVLKVMKNRLAKRVFEKEGLKHLDKYLEGPTAIASSEKDPAGVAKVLVEFAKEHEFLKVKGGYLEGRELTLADIGALAKLPSREVLLSKALASLLAPATNFVSALSAMPQKLVRVIAAVGDKKK